MKTSQKIILVAVAMITILIVVIMIIVRDDIQLLFVKDKDWNFKTIAVDEFQRLDFSANYHAEVVSGLEYSVEIAVKDSTHVFPLVKEVDGTLYFSEPDADSLVTNPVIKVRITMPLLRSVWGRRGSEITIRNFQSDSLTVSIEKGCKLRGKDNTIRFLTFRTGDALVEWTNNP
ncbi:GIN domain-containing protein [Parachryseolinea silvisoli]|jgi:hypothetical protein|uniref:GIN domain-containing protein n=1 Tax=Parachryseolinea silvisoli TaxID=2873601 RepID=UPI002265E39F|nr:DUF2807 domain-containing protein [Parachryseolinea silvisoli]MCD9019177.1 DUF2807 domain-containing protein [Parachryseolinea silvisoli]